MAIHWLIWLVIGAVVSFWSHGLGPKFTLFFYVGLVFIVVGVARMFISLVLKDKPKEYPAVGQGQARAAISQGQARTAINQGHVHPAVRHGTVHPAHTRHPAIPPQLQQSYFACPRCKAVINPAANFCSMCGLRIR